MLAEIIRQLWTDYRGRFVGCIIGLVIGSMFLILGFFRTLFLLICIFGGFVLGNKVDHNEDLFDILDRMLPPGYHK